MNYPQGDPRNDGYHLYDPIVFVVGGNNWPEYRKAPEFKSLYIETAYCYLNGWADEAQFKASENYRYYPRGCICCRGMATGE